MGPKPRWYELDSLLPYHDLIVLAGFLMVVAGVWLIGTWPLSHAAALIVAGGGVEKTGWMMARSS